jgi:FkbM family methyltransferase
VGHHGKVFAFEPLPDYYEYLKKAFNHKKNVEIFNLALSDQNSTKPLRIPLRSKLEMPGYATLENIDGPFREIMIETEALDSMKIEDVDFIKIDIEGHEYDFLIGAFGTLKSSLPILQIELNAKLNSIKVWRIIQLLTQNLNYKMYKFDGKSLIKIDVSFFAKPITKSTHLNSENFIFINDCDRENLKLHFQEN